MGGITVELVNFIHALLTGVILMSVYLVLDILRRLIRHQMWAVNAEDVIYWGFVTIYTFVQIHYTSDGKIRAYFILGIVVGVGFMRFFTRIIQKIFKKIYVSKKKN